MRPPGEIRLTRNPDPAQGTSFSVQRWRTHAESRIARLDGIHSSILFDLCTAGIVAWDEVRKSGGIDCANPASGPGGRDVHSASSSDSLLVPGTVSVGAHDRVGAGPTGHHPGPSSRCFKIRG